MFAPGRAMKTTCTDSVPLFQEAPEPIELDIALSLRQSRCLLKSHSSNSLRESTANDHDDHHGHGHGEKPVSFVNAFASAVINFLLMFGLCCAYGLIMFSDNHNAKHRAIGVKMNLITALVMGLIVSSCSKVNVAIGGPDLNPVVFLGGFISTISEELAKPVVERRLAAAVATGHDVSTACAALNERSIFLGPDSSVFQFEPDDHYHEVLRATAIWAVTFSTAILGILFFLLGRLRLTRFVTFVPSSVMEAFLSCVGYKVFKYSLKFCDYDPKQFLPAAAVGVPLYFMKAYHIGNPAVVIPTLLLVPLFSFHAIVLLSGNDVESARKEKFMFDYVEDVPFWNIWTEGFLKLERVNFGAWAKTLPDLAIMIAVVCMDCLLKISSTEAKMPVKVNKDYEIRLYGAGNGILTLCGASVGYMQLKFNIINYGILGNLKDRRAGLMYSILCGLLLVSVQPFNYMPRFFLGSLLFFAGSGFVAENLWGSRKYLSLGEWCEIVLILVVFIFTGKLLYAVIVGGLLTGITFIYKYSKVPAIVGLPLHGNEITSAERRSALVERNVAHIAQRWLLVIKLKGFLFFGSVQAVTSAVRARIEGDVHNPHEFERLKYLIFDCQLLDDLDASASKAMKKLSEDAQQCGVKVLWSNVDPYLMYMLQSREIIDQETGDFDCFHDLDLALLFVEESVLEYRHKMQNFWLRIHPTFQRCYDNCVAQVAYEPFKEIFMTDNARRGCPWQYCKRLKVRRFETVLFESNEMHRSFYLIHSGVVGFFNSIPKEVDSSRKLSPVEKFDLMSAWPRPHGIYGGGWFLNSRMFLNEPTVCAAIALEDGELLVWDEAAWWLMSRDRPMMASDIMKACMRQQADDAVYGTEAKEETDKSEFADAFLEDIARASRGLENLYTCATPKKRLRDTIPPEGMQTTLRNIEIARVLGAMGLYEVCSQSDELTIRPLPKTLTTDLEIAFATYCVGDVIPWTKVNDALQYVGLFGVMLKKNGPPVVDESMFMAIGHEATMARLSKEQRDNLRKIFDEYAQDDNLINREELGDLWKYHFKQELTDEEVDQFADEWDEDNSGQLDADEFESIISRLIRKHQEDYRLLKAFQELAHSGSTDDTEINLQDLVVSKFDVDPLKAEEMLWAADWMEVDQDKAGQRITLPKLVATLSCVVSAPKLPLPPVPRPRDDSAMRADIPDDEPAAAPPPSSAKPPESFSASYDAPTSAKLLVAPKRESSEPEPEVMAHVWNTIEEAPAFRPVTWISDWRISGDTNEELLRNPILNEEMIFERHRVSIGSQLHDENDDENDILIKGSQQLLQEEKMQTFRGKIFVLLEDAESSRAAFIYMLVMTGMILTAIGIMIMESVQAIKDGIDVIVWDRIEVFFTMMFTVEYFVRLSVANALGSQTTIGFMCQPSNICDIAAVTPWYVKVIAGSSDKNARLLRMVRLMRVARLSRLSRLAKRNPLVGPSMLVLMVIWGIYMKENPDV